MNLDQVLNDPPKPHNEAGQLIVMGLTTDGLRFIRDNADQSSATLETGCGLSTVAFALTGSRHFAISPAGSEFEILKSYCRERGIATAQIDFIESPSETVLPTLALPPLDLVLIDGRHGFPAPYIDWFYTAGRLKKGGHVIVDDVWVWSGQILRDFLAEQPQWEFVAEYEGRTAVFKKLAEGAEWMEWTQQPLVARGGRLQLIDGQPRVVEPQTAPATSAVRRALGDLGRGDFAALGKKVFRRIGG
ncbi:MAG: class I SAM-dependent methyltransferase [Acidobacteria bacterium]|nr:class I SAM-dependent methyltransferase [Acidobacteriota bacterium]MCA1640401.1 class I SAM-dependent methyltransferase [Acidobacteriota bacterium]